MPLDWHQSCYQTSLPPPQITPASPRSSPLASPPPTDTGSLTPHRHTTAPDHTAAGRPFPASHLLYIYVTEPRCLSWPRMLSHPLPPRSRTSTTGWGSLILLSHFQFYLFGKQFQALFHTAIQSSLKLFFVKEIRSLHGFSANHHLHFSHWTLMEQIVCRVLTVWLDQAFKIKQKQNRATYWITHWPDYGIKWHWHLVTTLFYHFLWLDFIWICSVIFFCKYKGDGLKWQSWEYIT